MSGNTEGKGCFLTNCSTMQRTVKQEGDTEENFLVEADEKMYEDKAAIKRAILEKGGTLHGRD